VTVVSFSLILRGFAQAVRRRRIHSRSVLSVFFTKIKYVECFSSRFFLKLVTIARTGKGLEDDGLSGRGREVA
jgi:hypothetical protein